MKKARIFLRTTVICTVIILSLTFGFIGVCRAYENIRLVGFGEYKSAFEISNGKIRLLDFEIDFY